MIVRVWISRLLALFRKIPLDHELDDEIRIHLEMTTEENVRHGMSPEEARMKADPRAAGIVVPDDTP